MMYALSFKYLRQVQVYHLCDEKLFGDKYLLYNIVYFSADAELKTRDMLNKNKDLFIVFIYNKYVNAYSFIMKL